MCVCGLEEARVYTEPRPGSKKVVLTNATQASAQHNTTFGRDGRRMRRDKNRVKESLYCKRASSVPVHQFGGLPLKVVN